MLTIRITGLELRCARMLLGLTQANVAERARVCAQSVKDWEHSSASVPRAYAETLGRLVGVLEDAGATFRSDGVYLRTSAARAAPSITATAQSDARP